MMRKLAFIATALLLVALSVPPADAAAPTQCTGFLTGAISGNLEVPAGAFCELIFATVTGNVTVRGVLLAIEVQISGNLTGNHADFLLLEFSTVGGNVVADHTTSGCFVLGSTIGGNLTVQQSSSSSFCSVDGAVVGRNLTFQNNLGGGDIFVNTIGGNLDCHNNTPPPTGSGNTVGGNEKGQCAGF